MRTGPVTAKGARQEQAIIEATLRCLGRDGYSATSLQRIADEAGVGKRMVLYYFRDREELLQRAVGVLGERLLSQAAEAVQGLEDPADIVAAGFDRVWGAITNDPALLSAYFGLVAESVTNHDLRTATSQLNEGFRALIGQLVADQRGRGRRLRMAEESLTVLIVAGLHGLTLEYLQRGDTPALRQAIADYQRWLVTVSESRR
jgi:AcrR family transcriptional regulator